MSKEDVAEVCRRVGQAKDAQYLADLGWLELTLAAGELHLIDRMLDDPEMCALLAKANVVYFPAVGRVMFPDDRCVDWWLYCLGVAAGQANKFQTEEGHQRFLGYMALARRTMDLPCDHAPPPA